MLEATLHLSLPESLCEKDILLHNPYLSPPFCPITI